MERRQQKGAKRPPGSHTTSETPEPPAAGRVPQREDKPIQPDTQEQSGSAGRSTGGSNPGKNTGQDRYGQNGAGGTADETDGQAAYRKSGPAGSETVDRDSDPAEGDGGRGSNLQRKR